MEKEGQFMIIHGRGSILVEMFVLVHSTDTLMAQVQFIFLWLCWMQMCM